MKTISSKITLLIGLVVALVIVGVVYAFSRNVSAPVVTGTTGGEQTTGTTGTTDNGSGSAGAGSSGTSVSSGTHKTYTNAAYGFSFEYPSTWNLAQSADGKSVTVDNGPTIDPSFNGMNIKGFSITIGGVTNTAFGEQQTKVGDIVYSSENMALVDKSVSPARCLTPQDVNGTSLPVILYGGSMMSDPAHWEYAMLTNKPYMILISESYEDQSDAITAGRAEIYSSLSLTNGATARVPNCAAPAQVTPPPVGTVPASLTPFIQSIAPTSGNPGFSVTLKGAGFLATNTVLFGGGPVNGVSAASDGKSLTFKVPSSVGADCKPNQACPMYERLITNGQYDVSVRNTNGTSNSVSFTVTGSQSPNPSAN